MMKKYTCKISSSKIYLKNFLYDECVVVLRILDVWMLGISKTDGRDDFSS